METLGKDGMSSDESEDDGEVASMRNEYRVKRMPWRRNITKELQILDGERIQDKMIFHRKGSKPAPRIRSPDAPLSSREALAKLPRSFYDDQWFDSLTRGETRKLAVSSTPFPWHNVVTDSA